MATNDSQPLVEFITNLLSDMDNGTLTAQEAVAASGQYGYLRELLDAQADQFSQAELLGDEAFTAAVRAAFQNAFSQLQDLANFQNQSPDVPIAEQGVRATATLRAAAVERIRNDGVQKLAPYQDRRRAFIHDLVEKFSSTLPVGAPDEKAMGAAVDRALAVAAGSAETAQTKDRFGDQLIAQARVAMSGSMSEDMPRQIKAAIRSTLSNNEYLTTAIDVTRSQKEMLDVVFTNLNTPRPDVIVDVLLNHPPNESIQDTKLRAIKLAGAASDLEVSAKPFPSSRGFFTPTGARGVAAGTQAAASGILSLVGEPFREMVLKEKVSGSLRAMFANTQTMVDRLGESFVQSSAFAQLTAGLNRSLGDRSSASQAGGVVSDVFSTIFRGPLGAGATGVSRERVFNFFELARANSNAPKGFEFFPRGALPWNIFSETPGAIRQAADSYTGQAGGNGRKPFFGLRGFGGIGIINGFGAWVGNTFTTGFDRTTSFLLSSPRIAGELSGSRRAAAIPTPFFSDMPKLVAVVVVVTLLLLFILPSPLNGPLVNYSAKVSSLLESLGELAEELTTTTNDNGWPVKCGCISQGPDEGTHAGSDLNAIDFLFGTCSPSAHVDLFATEDGVVSVVSQQYGVGERCIEPPPGQFAWNCGGKDTYGNFLIIHTDSGQDLLYGHLSSFTVSAGTRVQKGDKVGESDDNGVTTIEHLHFEVLKTSKDNTPLNQSNSVTPEAAVNGLCV